MGAGRERVMKNDVRKNDRLHVCLNLSTRNQRRDDYNLDSPTLSSPVPSLGLHSYSPVLSPHPNACSLHEEMLDAAVPCHTNL